MTAETIGSRVRALRQARGLTQQEVADAMSARGCTWRQSSVAKVEVGGRPFLLTEAVELAGLLGVTVSDLVDDTPAAADSYLAGRLIETELLTAATQQHVAGRIAELRAAVRSGELYAGPSTK